jgi:hypothetical protein
VRRPNRGLGGGRAGGAAPPPGLGAMEVLLGFRWMVWGRPPVCGVPAGAAAGSLSSRKSKPTEDITAGPDRSRGKSRNGGRGRADGPDTVI